MQDIVKIVEPGGTILDPFAGSGTTLVAAKLEGYNAVGIEVTKEYAAVAQRQIDTINS
jgi:site-specific DNA-methyltransferase (adenine-specific)